MSSWKKGLCIACGVLVGCLSASRAFAESVTFAGMDSDGRSATASFVHTGTTLTVTLTNSGGSGDGGGQFLLSGLFFTVDGGSLGSITSARAPTLYNFATNTSSTNVDIRTEWAYRTSVDGSDVTGLTSGSTYYGLSSTGLGGVFGQNDRILISTSWIGGGGKPPDGPALSIVPIGFTPNGSAPGTGTANASLNPLVIESAVFKFTVDAGFDATKISTAHFQYGTALGDANFGSTPTPTAVPLPSTAVAGGGLLGVLLLSGCARRGRNRLLLELL